MADLPDSLECYAERIEILWSDRLDRTSVFSQREFDLIERWFAAGIPVAIVSEAMDHALAVRPGRAPRVLRNLGDLEPAVLESWETVREGRVRGRSEPEMRPETETSPVTKNPAASATTRAPDESPDCEPAEWLWEPANAIADRAWRGWLEVFRNRHRAGESPREIDAAMDAELIEQAPAADRERCRDQVEARLAEHRHRMRNETYEQTRNRAWIDCLRHRLRLRRLIDGG